MLSITKNVVAAKVASFFRIASQKGYIELHSVRALPCSISTPVIHEKLFGVAPNFSTKSVNQLPKPPAKPGSAFSLFLKEKYKEVAQDNPDKKTTDVVKVLGQMWRSLDPSIKQPYVTEGQSRMEIYKTEKATFYNSLSDADKYDLKETSKIDRLQRKKQRKKKLAKKLERPKQILTSGYQVFAKEMRSGSNKVSKSLKESQEQMKQIAEKWKQLSLDQKQKYNAEAREHKLQYKQALELWEIKMLNYGHYNLIRSRLPKDVSPALKDRLKSASKLQKVQKPKTRSTKA